MSGGMRLSAGRKRDPICCRHDELPNKKVKCKERNKSFSSNADRMRAHSTLHDRQANVDEEHPVDSTPLQATQSNMEPVVIKTTQEKADQLDILVGKEHLSAGRDIVQYGCSAHLLNLLAKDLGPTRDTNSIVGIAKFFRNTHLPKSWLKDEGAKKPPMPCTVRWSSSLRLLEW